MLRRHEPDELLHETSRECKEMKMKTCMSVIKLEEELDKSIQVFEFFVKTAVNVAIGTSDDTYEIYSALSGDGQW